MATPTIDALLHTLSTVHGLHARPSVLRALLTSLLAGSAHPPPSGPGLIQSLRFRLLASDITVSLQPYANLCLPPVLPDHAPARMALSAPVSAAHAQAATPAATSSSSASDGAHVAAGIVVQVLDVTDLSSSRGDALDRLEMAARGEAMRGREVIRLVPSDDNASPIDRGDEGGRAGQGPAAAGGEGGAAAALVGGRDGAGGMHRLLLEDAAGRRVWAFELAAVPGIRIGMNIGAKILLRAGCEVARGVVLLTADTAAVLGGKVDALHKAWTDDRKAALLADIDRLRSAP